MEDTLRNLAARMLAHGLGKALGIVLVAFLSGAAVSPVAHAAPPPCCLLAHRSIG